MATIDLTVNGKPRQVDVDPNTPLLWVLRDALGLTGTKFGCGAGGCGACTVLIDGAARRSCMTPVTDVAGQSITTIEGLSPDATHALQKAWLAEQVPQCGYCQPAQILTAKALLDETPDPSDTEIGWAMSAVLCRCGTYPRIRRAIHRAAEELNNG